MDIDYFNFISKSKLEIGSIIVSQPYLADNYFHRSVILICDHNKNRSIGFQINKPLNISLKETIKNIEIDDKLYLGGPVDNKNIYFIHKSSKLKKNSIRLNRDIYFGGDLDYLIKLILNNKIKSNEYKFFLGYSGWSKGQLYDEIKDNSWIIISQFNSKNIFTPNYKNIWNNILKKSGGLNKMFSNYPIDPRLN